MRKLYHRNAGRDYRYVKCYTNVVTVVANKI